MVKYHTDSEKGNPLPPHMLLFPINSMCSFICTTPQTGLHIPQPFLHQSWSTGWNKKLLNGSTPWMVDPTTHRTLSKRSYHAATYRSLILYSKSDNWRLFGKQQANTCQVTHINTVLFCGLYIDKCIIEFLQYSDPMHTVSDFRNRATKQLQNYGVINNEF